MEHGIRHLENIKEVASQLNREKEILSFERRKPVHTFGKILERIQVETPLKISTLLLVLNMVLILSTLIVSVNTVTVQNQALGLQNKTIGSQMETIRLQNENIRLQNKTNASQNEAIEALIYRVSRLESGRPTMGIEEPFSLQQKRAAKTPW